MLDMNQLKARHAEELSDARIYCEMAKECQEWHDVLIDISKEEEEHAHMLEHIMEHM